jgi:hypothetical protein
METTEKIVEAYVRYIKAWATIPNIKCPGQLEIDLLAINPVTLERYHIETSVSISGGFSKLTRKPYDPSAAKIRVQAAAQRRTLGFFIQKKFGSDGIIKTLADYGFREGEYRKIIVSWDWDDGVLEEATSQGIDLWDFRQMLQEIGTGSMDMSAYFGDDTIRTIQLFARALIEKKSAQKSKVLA